MHAAITIIKDEHRALAAVLRGLEHLAKQIDEKGKEPDFALLKSMLDYIVAFPDKLHHPKEDAYLYRLLRVREPATAAVLDELEEEHRQGPELVGRVITALQGYQQDPAAFASYAEALADYARFQWDHMNKEEDVILPLADKALQPADWAEIDAAFKSNEDPLVGTSTQREFRDLFRRVVTVMPAPLGLGPEQD